MEAWQIVLIVIGSLLIFLAFLYLFFSWYSWKRCNRVNPSVPNVAVDAKEYSGTWYEIAAYPKWFEKGCSHTTAKYTPNKEGLLVENSCMRNGSMTTSRGQAYPTKYPGVFGVSFFPGIYGNYTVTYRDPQTSIVTNPDKSTLWILSRTPNLAHKDRIMRWLKEHNFDTTKLKWTENGNAM